MNSRPSARECRALKIIPALVIGLVSFVTHAFGSPATNSLSVINPQAFSGSFRENGPFYESDLKVKFGLDQTILVAHLSDPNAADIIVATATEKNLKTLELFEMQQGYYPGNAVSVHQLDDDVIFLDVGATVGRDMLVVFYSGVAMELNLKDGSRRPLIEFSSIYNAPVDQKLPKLDALRDLNDDGLDDFIIPGFKGYEVYIQRPDGTFGARSLLAAPPVMDMSFRQNPWYQAREIYHTDITDDGRADLVFWVDDEFLIFEQLGNGDFSAVPERFSPPVMFDAEGYEGVSMRMGGEDQSDVEKKALFRLRDYDADGIPELVTLSIKSEGVLKKSTTYEIHRGEPGTANETGGPRLPGFEILPASHIRSRGIQFDLEEKDLNNDGQIDIIVSSVEIGLGKIIRALLTGSIAIKLDFYQMEAGKYPEKPNLEREVTATFNMSSGDVFLPTVLITDINGDGMEDLVVQDGDDTIELYEGVNNNELFSRRAIEIKVEMPRDPDKVESMDLNADSKQDLVIQLEPLETDQTVSRLKVLVRK